MAPEPLLARPVVSPRLPTLRQLTSAVIITALVPVTLFCVFVWWWQPWEVSAPVVAVMLACVMAGGGLAFLAADRLIVRAVAGLDGLARDVSAADRETRSSSGDFKAAEITRVEAALRSLAGAVADQQAALGKADLQRDTLLREVHHRVKNSMQIVTSLLSLHASRIEDAAAAAAFSAAHMRINALAAIHREIYAAENLESIGVAPFLTNLFALSVPGAGRSRTRPTLEAGGEETIPPQMAIPLGMLVMELVTMVARGDGTGLSRRTRIAFQGTDSGVLVLTIACEGSQLQWEPLAGRRSDLGQMLANAYIQQLHATIDVESTAAASSLVLRIPPARSRHALGPQGTASLP